MVGNGDFRGYRDTQANIASNEFWEINLVVVPTYVFAAAQRLREEIERLFLGRGRRGLRISEHATVIDSQQKMTVRFLRRPSSIVLSVDCILIIHRTRNGDTSKGNAAPFFGVQPCDRKSRVPVMLANPSLPGLRSDPTETPHPLGCGRPLLSGIVTPMRKSP
jgi:hypothetical protein